MPIDSAKIEVMVNDPATIVKSDQITHDLGTIAGDLNFPRAHQLSPYLLSFTMDGELPLNDSRKIFGPKVEAPVNGGQCIPNQSTRRRSNIETTKLRFR